MEPISITTPAAAIPYVREHLEQLSLPQPEVTHLTFQLESATESLCKHTATGIRMFLASYPERKHLFAVNENLRAGTVTLYRKDFRGSVFGTAERNETAPEGATGATGAPMNARELAVDWVQGALRNTAPLEVRLGLRSNRSIYEQLSKLEPGVFPPYFQLEAEAILARIREKESTRTEGRKVWEVVLEKAQAGEFPRREEFEALRHAHSRGLVPADSLYELQQFGLLN